MIKDNIRQIRERWNKHNYKIMNERIGTWLNNSKRNNPIERMLTGIVQFRIDVKNFKQPCFQQKSRSSLKFFNRMLRMIKVSKKTLRHHIKHCVLSKILTPYLFGPYCRGRRCILGKFRNSYSNNNSS